MESPDEMGDEIDYASSERKSIGLEGGEVTGLELKLRELERNKEELAAYQLKVDEDIQAVKRTMELVVAASHF